MSLLVKALNKTLVYKMKELNNWFTDVTLF